MSFKRFMKSWHKIVIDCNISSENKDASLVDDLI